MTATAASPIASQSGRDTLPLIVVAGLAGGAVDLVYASSMALANGNPITRPWLSVASGWIGREAGQGGAGVVALGLATHFGIATCMAAAYVLLARRIPVVVARPYATALIYGLILYAVMYLGVLPLRFGVFPKWHDGKALLDVGAHIGVALAIAWSTVRLTKAINPKTASAAGL
jgi:hypothetical protein